MISDNSYLWAWKLERNETLHIYVQHAAIEVTDDCKALECDECYVTKYDQLVTTPSDTTVNSSYDFMV